MPEIVFFAIAFTCCLFAFLTVTARNIFHSAVWLTFSLLSVAGIYFFLDAEFLGVIQVLVYIGGIITLFIFAIKLTARIEDASIPQVNKQVVPSAIATILLFGLLFYIIRTYPWAPINTQSSVISLQQLGIDLLTTYLLPFEFLSVVLLAVMVGAIVVGKAGRR